MNHHVVHMWKDWISFFECRFNLSCWNGYTIHPSLSLLLIKLGRITKHINTRESALNLVLCMSVVYASILKCHNARVCQGSHFGVFVCDSINTEAEWLVPRGSPSSWASSHSQICFRFSWYTTCFSSKIAPWVQQTLSQASKLTKNNCNPNPNHNPAHAPNTTFSTK